MNAVSVFGWNIATLVILIINELCWLHQYTYHRHTPIRFVSDSRYEQPVNYAFSISVRTDLWEIEMSNVHSNLVHE
jgi:hypothetical protein